MGKISFYRGDTVVLNFAFANTDLTGATVYFTAKTAVDNDLSDSSAVAQETVTDHTDPTNGITQITLEPVQTTVIDPGKYGYDIQLKTADGIVSTVEVGEVIVKGDYTRRSS